MSSLSASTGPGPEARPVGTLSRLLSKLRIVVGRSVALGYGCAAHDLTAAHAVAREQAARSRRAGP